MFMRTFYAFHINEFYSSMYNDNPLKLYKILEELFYRRNYDKLNTYRLYKQVVIPFNKMLCNGYMTKKNRLCYEYFYDYQAHYLKKKEEHTKMVIGSIHIKILSDANYPIFFNNIHELDTDIFICDFDNRDYFWLDKIIKIYRQKEIPIVK